MSRFVGKTDCAVRTVAALSVTALALGLGACGDDGGGDLGWFGSGGNVAEDVAEDTAFHSYECPVLTTPEDADAEVNLRWSNEESSYHEREECPTQDDADAFYAAQEDDSGSGGSPNPSVSDSVPEVRESPSIAEDRRVYRNSADFAFLDSDGLLTPGAKYIVDGAGGQGNCSFGWMVHLEGETDRVLNLTAGHCGKVGDKVYVQAQGQNPVNVGEFVWRNYDGTENMVGPGPDYALIEIYPGYFDYVTAIPGVTMGSRQVDLKGWAGKDWLEQNQPYMCRLGFRSGLSCGNFQQMANDISITYDALSDHGDSGGTVWAFDPSDSSQTQIFAVGVTSWVDYEDATTAGAKTVEAVMNAQNLKIYAF